MACRPLQPLKPGDPLPSQSRRRALHRLGALTATVAGSAWVAACGGAGAGDRSPSAIAPPPPPPPPPPPSATLTRLRAALARPALMQAGTALTLSQGQGNSVTSSFGAGAIVEPPLDSVPAQSLATAPGVWGFGRSQWTVPASASAVIAGHAVYPVRRLHAGATLASEGVCGLHFTLQGSAFELQMVGTNVQLTLVVDGQYGAARLIDRALSAGVQGAPLNQPNALIRIDFGSPATRQISLYARSSQGPCGLVMPQGARLLPWDRSDEASMAVMTDSYGGASGPLWGVGGPFLEAAALLGMPHADVDAIGGTGYAPNSTLGRGLPGDAFGGRLAGSVDTRPDLFFTAGGINDNSSFALAPYATAEAARAGFEGAVLDYFRRLRAALPDSVLVAMGPWAPRQEVPTNPAALSKADTIRQALQGVGGPWVFLDNLAGGWRCSSGATGAATGPWQTGTGTAASPNGTGNGDLYLDADGVHPNPAGCLHLGRRIADDLRAALATL